MTTTTKTKNSPITQLSPRSKALWEQCLEERYLTDLQQTMLRHALQSLDTADQAREQLQALGGYTTTDRYHGERLHPLARVEMKSRAVALDVLGKLGFTGITG